MNSPQKTTIPPPGGHTIYAKYDKFGWIAQSDGLSYEQFVEKFSRKSGPRVAAELLCKECYPGHALLPSGYPKIWLTSPPPSPHGGNGEKLELVTQADAETEKKLQTHKANVILFEKGVQRSGGEFFGYTFLLGRELNLIAADLPGGFEEWMGRELPDMERSKVFRYREFARMVEPKIAQNLQQSNTLQCPTVGLAMVLPWKKKIPAKAIPAILKSVPEVMDGKGMMEFMRGEKLLNEPAPAGGARNPHPGESRTPTAEEEIKNATAMIDAYKTQVKAMIDDRANFLKAKPSNIIALEDLRAELGRHIAAMQKERKA